MTLVATHRTKNKVNVYMRGSCSRNAYFRTRRTLTLLMFFLSVCNIVSAQMPPPSASEVEVSKHSHHIVLNSLSCSSSSMTASGSDTCTVTLSAATGSGVNVSLATNTTAVNVPATVRVPANATSVGFTASASAVTSAQSVTLTASLNGMSQSFAIELDATLPTLAISPSSLLFGAVTVNTASTLPVTLTSTGTTAVTINSATLSGTGFTMSGASFPVTVSPGLAVTLDVKFDPTSDGSAVGQLTIQSNSVTGASAVITLSGTGASQQVSLSWSAPESSSDPVVGYYVYRSTGGSTSYQQLNSSADQQTTYVDSTVQAGLTYDYIVKSVDSAETQSSASNSVAVTIP